MPKKIKNCFYKNLTFEKLLEAHYRAKKNKRYKKDVITFELNLENNLTNLLTNIKNKTYHIGKYNDFIIYEPKKRLIKSLPYIDRVVHQWYVEEFIKPHIVPKFINSSFACITNRGTHKAMSTVQKYMQIYKRKNKDFWILKCDISKFFYSINPNILFNILKKYIKDKELLEFTRVLIFDSGTDEVGIPIGNYTSQFFANIYLNELDQYIKRTLKIKYYVRYMDDFVLLLPNKETCKKTKKDIEDFIGKFLELRLNSKSHYYPNAMGVNFCGYVIYPTHKLLRQRSKIKIKKNIKKWNKLYNNNSLHISDCMQSLNSWLGHSSHCNSYTLQKRILNSCDFLINDKYYIELEKELISLKKGSL